MRQWSSTLTNDSGDILTYWPTFKSIPSCFTGKLRGPAWGYLPCLNNGLFLHSCSNGSSFDKHTIILSLLTVNALIIPVQYGLFLQSGSRANDSSFGHDHPSL
jgi:hypothetical protein